MQEIRVCQDLFAIVKHEAEPWRCTISDYCAAQDQQQIRTIAWVYYLVHPGLIELENAGGDNGENPREPQLPSMEAKGSRL